MLLKLSARVFPPRQICLSEEHTFQERQASAGDARKVRAKGREKVRAKKKTGKKEGEE